MAEIKWKSQEVIDQEKAEAEAKKAAEEQLKLEAEQLKNELKGKTLKQEDYNRLTLRLAKMNGLI